MGVSLWLRRVFRGSPVVAGFIAVIVVAWVLFALAARNPDLREAIADNFILLPAAVAHLEKPWTVVTYALLHDITSWAHLLFNALMIYWFGRDLEVRWGSRRIALLLFASVLMGALAVMSLYAIGLGGNPVLGASAAALGLGVAWGLTYRDRELMFFFFIRMRGLTMVYVMLGIAVLDAISMSNVSAAAHFGGMAAGALFALLGEPSSLRRAWLRWRMRRLEAKGGARVVMRPKKGGGFVPELRVIKGEKSDPPKDKRWLN